MNRTFEIYDVIEVFAEWNEIYELAKIEGIQESIFVGKIYVIRYLSTDQQRYKFINDFRFSITGIIDDMTKL